MIKRHACGGLIAVTLLRRATAKNILSPATGISINTPPVNPPKFALSNS